MARLVRAMVIDDVSRADAIRNFDDWVEVTQIKDCFDVFEHLSKQRYVPYDLLILDVDLRDSRECFSQSLHWSAHNDNSPFCGPLLALPLLGSSPNLVIERYSSYWNKLGEEGYPLTAISLLLSATQREYISPIDAAESVSSGVGASRLLAELPPALRSALSQFRSKLKERAQAGEIEFIDLHHTVDQLITLLSIARDESTKLVTVPFLLDSEELSVKFVGSSDRYLNSISVHSLFTDLLLGDQPTAEVSTAKLESIISLLEQWCMYSHTRSQGLWELALDAMNDYENAREHQQKLKVDEVIDNRVTPTGEDTSHRRFLARRLVLVLSWVNACFTYQEDPMDPSARAEQRNARKTYVNSLLCLGENASTLYKRILGNRTMDSQWQEPFFPEEQGEQAQYSLNKWDEQANLTPYLKFLARRYAVERLDWHGPYPEWMI